MFGINLRSTLAITILICLVTTLIITALIIYRLSYGSVAFVYDAADPNKVTTKGTTASDFWAHNKMLLIAPTVVNVINILMVGLLLYV